MIYFFNYYLLIPVSFSNDNILNGLKIKIQLKCSIFLMMMQQCVVKLIHLARVKNKIISEVT